ncbi:hypothetical protein V2J09_024192 [Rumex salicifolius]
MSSSVSLTCSAGIGSGQPGSTSGLRLDRGYYCHFRPFFWFLCLLLPRCLDFEEFKHRSGLRKRIDSDEGAARLYISQSQHILFVHEKMSLFSSIYLPLLPLLFSLLCPAMARGGDRSSDLPGRHLLNENMSNPSVDLARGYMTNAELENAVMAFGEKCSNISRIYSIGRSVNGVPLWVMEISDHPGKEEPKPAFKYIGNVHGDEPVGRELLLQLANWLCDNYLKDPLATLIVENVHLHILPSMNPDGYELKRRGNAKNVDLNRDFPDQFFGTNNDIKARQPETKAIMHWLKRIQFTASASLHGGALVANFPWDGTQNKRRNYYACPDDEAFQSFASIYSHYHYNMSQSKEFPGGITNGASWYPIYGGMQDWNYIHAGCFELTLEISDNKWPKSEELPTLWEYNKMSMLNLVAAVVKNGVHGRVMSSDSGRPLPASISIKGINYTHKAKEPFADYHRLLAPGVKYEVTASMPGYKSKSASVWLEKEATTADFILDPEDALNRKRVSSDCDCNCDTKGSLEMADIFVKPHMEISLVIVVLLVFFCLILRRRVGFNYPKHRQPVGPKRPVVI